MGLVKIEGRATTNTDTSNPFTANLPSSVKAGDLLLLVNQVNNSATQIAPDGWVLLLAPASSGLLVAYRRSDGTETTVDVADGSAGSAVAHTWRISNWGWVGVSNSSTGVGTSPDPAAVTSPRPGFLVIAVAGNPAGDSYSGFPSGYTNGTTASNISAGLGYAESDIKFGTVSEDPGTFTQSNSTTWYACSIAVLSDIRSDDFSKWPPGGAVGPQ